MVGRLFLYESGLEAGDVEVSAQMASGLAVRRWRFRRRFSKGPTAENAS